MKISEDETVLAGRYRLERVLGRSETGVVWQAHDETLMRQVAVKEMHISADVPAGVRAAARVRLLAMARLIELGQSGIVPVYDVFYEGVRCYVVRGLVEGYSLAEELDSGGPLPPQQVAAIGSELIDLLSVAHEAGIAHGGIKPSNVLFANDGRLFVTDFGMAINPTAPWPSAAHQLGASVGYLSPERLEGRTSSPLSDIWSLGATLYAALEGRPPFQATTTTGTIAAVLSDDVPTPHVAGPLREVLLGCLQKEPESRLRENRVRSLLQKAANRRESDSPEYGATLDSVPAPSIMEPFTWADDDGSPKASSVRRRLLSVAGVVAGLVAVVLITAQALSWNPFADAQTAPESPAVEDRVRRPLPDAFPSRALFRFSRDLFAPADCRQPAAGEFTFLEQIPDDETVFCEAGGYELRLFRKSDSSDLNAERRLYADGALEGSVERISTAPSGPAGVFDGRHFSFMHASDNQARIYWDSVRCACGGVLTGADDNTTTTTEFWLGG